MADQLERDEPVEELAMRAMELLTPLTLFMVQEMKTEKDRMAFRVALGLLSEQTMPNSVLQDLLAQRAKQMIKTGIEQAEGLTG